MMLHYRPELSVIVCVELASKRAAAAVHGEMKRGIFSLAIISSTAPLLGVFATVGSAHWFSGLLPGSRRTALGILAEYIAEAMLPTLLGLLVAIMAFWFHRYLGHKMETFDLEMAGASDDLMNRLLSHLGQLPKMQRIAWPELTETAEPVKTPRFRLRRMYPYGIRELIWPRLECRLDAELILHAGMWVSVACGLVSWLAYYWVGRPVSGFWVFAFFGVAGWRVRAGSRLAIVGLAIVIAFSSIACIVPYRATFPALCLALALLFLGGSFKAAFFIPAAPASERFRPALVGKNLLFLLLAACACMAALRGTSLSFYTADGSYSMEPILHRDDRILSVNASLAGARYRGELVVLSNMNSLRIWRVAGLPGDRIEVRLGKLIRNSKPVEEPYSWSSTEAALENYTYGLRAPYIVPMDSVFLLNDDRNELDDSRDWGAVPYREIGGRPFLAFNPFERRWFFPRIIR
jgi:signal peptidase I